MSGGKPSFEFAQTLLVFGALVGICVWVGTLVASRGEERLEQACRPVEVTTNLLHQTAYALSGTQPTWTLYVQRYMMTGCYYFFSVLFSHQKGLTIGGDGTVETDTTIPLGDDDTGSAGGIHN